MQTSKLTVGGLATVGMFLALVGTILSKLASLGAQLVLGWMLSTQDFALYAIAISWSSVVLALRNAGTQKLLIQKGSRYEELAGVYFKVALLVNGIGFAVLGMVAPVLSVMYENQSLSTMIWIIAISLPLNTASLIFQAKLSAALEFRRLTRITVWSALLRHGSMALFAVMGLGCISFVLPLIVIAVFETVAGWYAVGLWPQKGRLTWSVMCDILKESRWVMLTTLAAIFVMNGDYLAISLLRTKETLGIYFFGFQLSFSLAALFANSIEAVMMPTFSRLEHEPERQKLAFLKAIRVLMLGATLACFTLVVTANPLVHGLWAGKWDSAIPVVQILALSLPVKLLIPLCRSLIEGLGKWKLVSLLLVSDGIGTVVAGGLGAWLGTEVTIAATIGMYNVIFGLTFCGVVASYIGARSGEMIGSMFVMYAFGLLALLVTAGLTQLVSISTVSIWQAIGLVFVHSVVFLGLTRLFLKGRITELTTLIRQQLLGVRLARG